ncbi:MAG: Tfp pilus assembly protein FimT/FimU [Victivallales bacterium]
MKKIHRYTLVELLVVVAIAAVILGIATPAFTAMMKGGAMTSTTRELAAKIKAARSYAVTNNCYVALVFPTGTSLEDTGKTDFYFRCYRPCIVYKNEEDKWVFDSWIDGENWKLMNKGIVINKEDKDFCFIIPASGSTAESEEDLPAEYIVEDVPLGKIKSISTTDETIKKDVVRAIIFKPNGQLAGIELSKSLRFRLMEGVPVSKDNIQATNVFTEGSDRYTMVKTFIINPLTCKIEFRDDSLKL